MQLNTPHNSILANPALNTSLNDSSKNLGKPTTDDKIAEQAVDFEAVFLAQFLQGMFAGLETDGPFGGGHAEETFRSMMLDEYGSLMAKAGGFGLADHVQAELLKLQEMSE